MCPCGRGQRRCRGKNDHMADLATHLLERVTRTWNRITEDRMYLGDLVDEADRLGVTVPEAIREDVVRRERG